MARSISAMRPARCSRSKIPPEFVPAPLEDVQTMMQIGDEIGHRVRGHDAVV